MKHLLLLLLESGETFLATASCRPVDEDAYAGEIFMPITSVAACNDKPTGVDLASQGCYRGGTRKQEMRQLSF